MRRRRRDDSDALRFARSHLAPTRRRTRTQLAATYGDERPAFRMAAPAPPPRRRRVLLPLFFAIAAAAGIAWSFAPDAVARALGGARGGAAHGSSGGACPPAIVAWRASSGADAAAGEAAAWLAAAAASVRLAVTPRAAPRARAPPRDAATGLPLWAPADLAAYTGARGPRIVLGVCGAVYDVTALGARFYGPGNAYALFAGRDATRALALGSTDAADVARGGDVDGVPPQAVADQCKFYEEKYGPRIGLLKATPRPQPSVTPPPAAAELPAAAEPPAAAAVDAPADAAATATEL